MDSKRECLACSHIFHGYRGILDTLKNTREINLEIILLRVCVYRNLPCPHFQLYT